MSVVGLDRGDLRDSLLQELEEAQAMARYDRKALDKLRARWLEASKELMGWELAVVEVAVAVLEAHPACHTVAERALADFCRDPHARAWLSSLERGWAMGYRQPPSDLWQGGLARLIDGGLLTRDTHGYRLTRRGEEALRRVYEAL